MKKVIIIANKNIEGLKSNIPSIFHEIIDKPMINKQVDNFSIMNFDAITAVIDKANKKVKETLPNNCEYLFTNNDIVDFKKLAELIEDKEGVTILTYGNVPNITQATYQAMIEKVAEFPMVMLTSDTRINKDQAIVLRNPIDTVRSLVDYREANTDQKQVKEVALDVFAFDNKLLYKYLKQVEDAKQEVNPFALVPLFKADGHHVLPYKIEDYLEALPIYTRQDLVLATNWERNRIVSHWLDNGVTIYDGDSVVIGSDVEIGYDTVIYQNNIIVGKTKIGRYNTLNFGNFIKDSEIGVANTIEQSRIIKSIVKDHNNFGPWANLREYVVIGNKNRIGTSVELKQVTLQDNNALAHNVYLGNTNVGNRCNIGWGVVTANYNGKSKSKTNIGDDSFIGSSSTLIAPMDIGNQVVVAAGSVVSGTVEDGDMIIGRSRAEIKNGKGKLYLERDN